MEKRMIKKPNLPSLKLWELAKEWNKKFADCDLSADDILRYGINGDLPIYAEIPQLQSCLFEEIIYMNKADFQKTYPNKFNNLLTEAKEKEIFEDKKSYSGSYIEPLQKEILQTIYLSGAVKLVELQDAHNPNRVLRHKTTEISANSTTGGFLYMDSDGSTAYMLEDEPFPLTKKNLCVLRKDITAFEEKYFLSEEPKSTIDKANVVRIAISQTIKETAIHNNADHDSFAPELAIACEIWNYLYVENQIRKGKNIKSQVTSWLKNNKDKYAKYFLHTKDKDFPSQELCKRLSTVITPQARKGGGIESIE
jgi:hypothetical protein